MRVEIYYTTKNPQFPWGTVTIDIDWQESIIPPGIIKGHQEPKIFP